MSQLPPIHALTAEDRGPIVIVTAYVCIAETVLFTIIKLVSNNVLKRKLDWDDGLLFSAVVLALAQSIITEKAAVNGVGSFQASLTQSQLERYFKASKAVSLLQPVLTQTACLHSQYSVTDSAGACEILSDCPHPTIERNT